jgi:hypothetical protein
LKCKVLLDIFVSNAKKMKTGGPKKLKTQTLLSLLILGIGILLMVFKIYADSEPGAIPLFMVLVGAAWYFIIRLKLRQIKIG